MSKKIYPVILCGGSGTRLWPASRKSYPKQFTSISGDFSLFQQTVQRFKGEQFTPPLVITGNDYRFVVTEQLAEIDSEASTILIEPNARNTAPATLVAALWLKENDPDGIMLICPSDHLITDSDGFSSTVSQGAELASDDNLITFGITPDRAETGYGWLELESQDSGSLIALKGFTEKPNREDAEMMLASGQYLWNAGIFMFSVSSILNAFAKYSPDMLSPAQLAVDGSSPDLNFVRLNEEAWDSLESISIDYAIMEKADNIFVIPYAGAWTDLGGWDAVWRHAPKDDRGVSEWGSTTAIDCENTLLRSDSENREVVGLGLKNMIVVSTKDAVLVADADRAQDVKEVVSRLKLKKSKQAETSPIDHRPWGSFETITISDRYQVKQITVKPGGSLSLQSHMHRSEHWIVVSGTALVTIGSEKKLVSENQSVYIPLGEIHRMENPGKLPMTLIEVQTGSYLGEDDIIRYEDVYSRD